MPVNVRFASVLIALAASQTIAGPLTPPAGPVGTSYKTLTDVEPRTAVSTTNTPGDATSVVRITAAGSYYLTGNITSAAGKVGVKIESDGVTLDLSGFTISGVAGSIDGIQVNGTRRNIVIRNGIIRGHPGSGILAGAAFQSVFEDLLISSNTLDGLTVGNHSRVSRVVCADNTRDGFSLPNALGSIVEDCVSINNTLGFRGIASDCIVKNCIARGNRADGFELNAGTRISNCVATVNTGWGFRAAGDRTIIDGCNAESNTGGGFRIGAFDNAVSRCVSRGNGRGTTPAPGFLFASGQANLELNECASIFNGGAGFEIAGGRATLRNCAALENGGKGLDSPGQLVKVYGSRIDGNTGIGADVGQGSVLEECSIRNSLTDGVKVNGNGNATIRRSQIVSNNGNGLTVVNGSVVEDCLISSNTLNGINATALSAIRRCTFDGNGTAAGTTNAHIFCNGNANFIEDNTIYSGDPAIQITSIGGGTIVRRNMVVGTANNYGLIAAGNRVAPINTTTNLATTNPNDNFSY